MGVTKGAKAKGLELASAGEILPACVGDLGFLFEERALLSDEDPAAYDRLVQSVLEALRPQDFFEAMWCKDIVDYVWEAKRLRRWKARLLELARASAIEQLLRQAVQGSRHTTDADAQTDVAALVAGWSIGNPASVRQVSGILQERGIDAEAVAAVAFSTNLPEIERLDRLILAGELRRDGVLREMERRRDVRGRQLRPAAECIAAGELSTTDPVS